MRNQLDSGRRPGGWRGPRRRAVAWAAAGVLAGGGLAGGAVASAGPAAAAGPAPSCAGGSCTVTFSTPGTGQSFTVPAGVSSLTVNLYGGAGGGKQGGDGALVTAQLAVTAGEVLGVDVGGAGASAAGGVNGGGGNLGSGGSGGGGGATDVTSSGTELLVAGGGGGSGQTTAVDISCPMFSSVDLPRGPGGNADTAGQDGTGLTANGLTVSPGGGGTAGSGSAAGTGGTAGTATGSDPSCSVTMRDGGAGEDGSDQDGGDGGIGKSNNGGGGGGGGYFGGGGGGSGAGDLASDNSGFFASSGGGGGGSSYDSGAGVSNAAISDTGNPPGNGPNGGDGEAVISYANPVTTGLASYTATEGQPLSVTAANGLLSAAAGTSGPSGGTLSASASGSTAQGGTVTVNSDGSFTYTPPSGFSGTDTFAYTVSDASGDQATGTVTVTVTQPAVAPSFTAASPPLAAAAGTPYSYQFTASGTPAPSFTLGGGAPSWLSVSAAVGLVTGTPPAGTKSFSYSVTATSSAGSITAGPFTVAVSAEADVKAALSCPPSLSVGGPGTCTLTVTNAGPALAAGTVAGATVPAQLKVTGCSDGCSQLGGLLAWKLGSLPAGQSDMLTIAVTAARAGTAIVAAADGSASPDPNLLNNLAAATVKVAK